MMIRKTMMAVAAIAALATATVTTEASARPGGWHGHGGGGWHGGHGYRGGGWRGPGVGAAIGLGLLGAAATAGAYNYYNGPAVYGAYGGDCYRTRVWTSYGWRIQTQCY